MDKEKKPLRPIYKASFSITEELYESPDATEPIYSRKEIGRFSLDLVRVATVGLAALAASAVLALIFNNSQND